MSNDEYLHSHSAIERYKQMPKHVVLVDLRFAPLFSVREIRKVRFKNVDYIEVPTWKFVKCGGVFRNYDK